jgi:alpha-mannosidase
MPSKKIIEVTPEKSAKIVIFNSLTRERIEAISVKVSSADVVVKNGKGNDIDYQVNPILETNSTNKFSMKEFELIFIAKLSGMSLNTFTITHKKNEKLAKIFCDNCIKNEIFETEKLDDELKIKNSKMKLNFDKSTGFLKSITKDSETVDVKINFGGYKSRMRASGAYLFKPNNEIEDIFKDCSITLFITRGPIASDVFAIRGNLITHKIRIFNTSSHLNEAIMISNEIDLRTFPQRLDVEFFMRISTSIKNGEIPEFFTDQNGFQWLPRRKIPSLSIESNYYPITSSAFMQDDSKRLTLMTTHAQGAASFNEGELEVMLDRRIMGDDNRGMGEGILDSIRMQHNFYLTIDFLKEKNVENYQTPSLLAQHLTNTLNYPANIFTFNREVEHERSVELFSYQFPCDFHLVNLRTLSSQDMPSKSALLVVHRTSYDCQLGKEFCKSSNKFDEIQFLNDISVSKVQRMSLTGNNLRSTVKSFNEHMEPMEL